MAKRITRIENEIFNTPQFYTLRTRGVHKLLLLIHFRWQQFNRKKQHPEEATAIRINYARPLSWMALEDFGGGMMELEKNGFIDIISFNSPEGSPGHDPARPVSFEVVLRGQEEWCRWDKEM